MSDSDGKTSKVPGLDVAVEYELGQDDRFRHGAIDITFDRMTVREVSMLGLMEALTDKPSWYKKVFDDTITSKWREEALRMPRITEKTFEWCLKELQDKAKDYEATNLVTVLDMGSRCVKADQIVPPELQNALKSGVKPLIDHKPRDWHPGSEERVLNLVHPSLYPAVYGKTPVLKNARTNLENPLAPQNNTMILGQIAITKVDDGSKGGDMDDTGDIGGDDDDDNADDRGSEDRGHDEDNANAWNDFDDDDDGDENFWADSGQVNVWDDGSQENRGAGRSDRWSTKFQWLPCDVSFANMTDTSVKIVSYINNLHPSRNKELYHTVESFISLSIPAWNQVLVKHRQGRTPLRIKTLGPDTEPADEPEWMTELLDNSTSEARQRNVAKVREYLTLPDDPDFADSDDEPPENWEEDTDQIFEAVVWKYRRIRKTFHPEPGVKPAQSYEDWKAGKISEASRMPGPKIYNFEYTDVKIEDTFRKSGLQVIVKLASIELTPTNPSYPGGNWHLEGMMNEHIVATSIYYYDVSNITESRIRFRQEAMLDSVEMIYPQNDHGPLCELFGTESLTDEPAIQEIGSIATPENRLLAFPNTLQHKVEPFTLADTTKPGHRRFLVLWLVDPHYKVLSTGNVPPQQHDWWVEKAKTEVGGKVPREVQNMIEEEMRDGTMTLEEAKEYRLELMAERTSFTDVLQDAVETYDFCEH